MILVSNGPKCAYTLTQCFMIVKLPFHALFHMTFLGIIITIYFIVKLSLYDMDLPNQGNAKL